MHDEGYLLMEARYGARFACTLLLGTKPTVKTGDAKKRRDEKWDGTSHLSFTKCRLIPLPHVPKPNPNIAVVFCPIRVFLAPSTNTQ